MATQGLGACLRHPILIVLVSSYIDAHTARRYGAYLCPCVHVASQLASPPPASPQLRALAGLVEGEEPQGAGSDAARGRGLGTVMVVKRQQETFEPVTLARVPRPACLLRLWTVPPQRDDERGLAAR